MTTSEQTMSLDQTLKNQPEMDADFEKLSAAEQELVRTLGTEWGQEIAEKNDSEAMNIEQFLAQAPRSLRRKLQPHKKFGSTLMKRLRK